MATKNFPENDSAVRLHYGHTWGDLFVHACQAREPETADRRDIRVDRLMADIQAHRDLQPDRWDDGCGYLLSEE